VVSRSEIPPESWNRAAGDARKNCWGMSSQNLHAIQLYKADFNCYNQFIFGKAAMDSLNSIGYMPKELLQKGSTSEDAKFDKTLMANLS
jgi:hypothetical protein